MIFLGLCCFLKDAERVGRVPFVGAVRRFGFFGDGVTLIAVVVGCDIDADFFLREKMRLKWEDDFGDSAFAFSSCMYVSPK
jgi:hypothetical protein